MLLYRERGLVNMTLAIAVENGKDIVLCADELAIVETAGKLYKETDHEKFFKINDHTMLALAGGFSEQKLTQFLEDFKHSVRYKAEFDDILARLYALLMDTYHLAPNEFLQLILAGYNGKEPVIKAIFYYYETQRVRILSAKKNYVPVGIPECLERHKKLIDMYDTKHMTTKELERTAIATVGKCIDEFPEQLGGKPRPKVLRRL